MSAVSPAAENEALATGTLFAARGLSFRYEADRPETLAGVSFDVNPGTITAILGPNGAGKTTLLRVLLGLKRPTAGELRLAGRELTSFSRRELSRWVGLVPQSEALPFDYSVLEYVLLGRAPHLDFFEQPGPQDVRAALEALQTVGARELAARPIPALSGGELQLVLIARALAQQPRVLLLDEPSAHLDLSNRNTVLRLLQDLRSAGTTVLFSTHDPEAAGLVADNLVLMRSGRILFAGSTADTLTSDKLSQTYGVPVEVERFDGVYWVKARAGLSRPAE